MYASKILILTHNGIFSFFLFFDYRTECVNAREHLFTIYMSSTVLGSQRMFRTEPARNSSTYARNGDINRRRLMHRAKNKSLRISVVIVMAFLIWWTPYYTMMIIFLFLNPDEHVSISGLASPFYPVRESMAYVC